MDNHNNDNILPNLKTSSTLYPVMLMIVFLIIMLSLIFFKVPINLLSNSPPKSQNEIVANIFIILFFSLLVFLICFALLPNFKQMKNLFLQINSVTYVLLYTVFIVLFLSLMPNNILNS